MDQAAKDQFRRMLESVLSTQKQKDEIELGVGIRRLYTSDTAIQHLLTRIEELETQIVTPDQHWQHIIQQQGIIITTLIEYLPDPEGNVLFCTPAFIKAKIAERLNAIEKPFKPMHWGDAEVHLDANTIKKE